MTPGEISTISLMPVSGPPGTSVTVHGEGWLPQRMVLIYLTYPDDAKIPDYALAGPVADITGRFVTNFILPAAPQGEYQAQAIVIARTDGGEMTTQASFNIISQMSQTTATPTAVVTPTITPTLAADLVVPTATATPEPPTPTATPEPAQPGVTATTNLNIRSGPGIAYPIIGLLPAGQSAHVSGVSSDGGWWQITFSSAHGDYGWVSARYVIAQDTYNVPVVEPVAVPPPSAAPTPTPVIVAWRGEYYSNRDLTGPPILVRNDDRIDFNWGANAPAATLPADNFSARWSRTLSFGTGQYRFHAFVDDGVRLYVDNDLVIDSWYDGTGREVLGERWLSGGDHRLRIEYYIPSATVLPLPVVVEPEPDNSTDKVT